jgi:hypothetical protein
MFTRLPKELKLEILDFIRPPRVESGLKQLVEWGTKQKPGRDIMLYCEVEDWFGMKLQINLGFDGDTREVDNVEIQAWNYGSNMPAKYTNVIHMGLRGQFDPAEMEQFLPRGIKIPPYSRLKVHGAAFLLGLEHLDHSELWTAVESFATLSLFTN